MSHTSAADYPQDDLSGTLATPLGTDDIAPRRPEPLAAVVEIVAPAPAADVTPAGGAAQPAASEGSSRLMQLTVGAAVVACTGLGLFAWLG